MNSRIHQEILGMATVFFDPEDDSILEFILDKDDTCNREFSSPEAHGIYDLGIIVDQGLFVCATRDRLTSV